MLLGWVVPLLHSIVTQHLSLLAFWSDRWNIRFCKPQSILFIVGLTLFLLFRNSFYFTSALRINVSVSAIKKPVYPELREKFHRHSCSAPPNISSFGPPQYCYFLAGCLQGCLDIHWRCLRRRPDVGFCCVRFNNVTYLVRSLFVCLFHCLQSVWHFCQLI